MALKSMTVRLEEELLDKLHIISDYEGRSAGKQALVLIRRCVESYEKNHPEIFENYKK